MTLLRCKRVSTPIGPLRIAVGGLGVCHLAFPNCSERAWQDWFAKHFGEEPEEGPHSWLEDAAEQLRLYFERRLTRFDLPLELRGTRFQQLVWRTLLEIPMGHTWSYGEVAQRIGSPRAAQAVGAAVGANPIPVIVPCHRVIGADGALVGFGGGLDTKVRLLELEGARPSSGQLALWEENREQMRKKTQSSETMRDPGRRATTEGSKGVLR